MAASVAIVYATSAYACVTINNSWSSFVSVAASGENVTFCPFTVDKPIYEVFLVNKTISLSCLVPKKCHIRGRGTHFSLNGRRAFLSIQGFSLSGATESAIRISGTTKSHILRDCVFLENNACLNATLGGAVILMGTGTSMAIHSPRFFDKQASVGGAIAIMGASALFVESSIFQDNLALYGSAIFVHGSPGTVKLKSNRFFGNMATFASSGVIHIETDEAAILHGQNLGVNNGECSGVHNAFQGKCFPFQLLQLPPFKLGTLRELKGGVYLSQGLKIRAIAHSGACQSSQSRCKRKSRLVHSVSHES